MLDSNYLLGGLMIVFLAACTSCLLAMMVPQIRAVINYSMVIFAGPLQKAAAKLSSMLTHSWGWLKGQVDRESVREGDGPLYYAIGALLYSILTSVFIMADIGVICLTFSAMGFGDSHLSLPVDLDFLAGTTLISSALIWGLICGDLIGVTHLAPWKKVLSKKGQIAIGMFGVSMIGFAVFLGCSGGWWRAEMLADQARMEAEDSRLTSLLPEQLALGSGNVDGLSLSGGDFQIAAGPGENNEAEENAWVPKLSNMGISALSLITTAFSGWGVIMLVKFMMVSLVALGLGILQCLVWLARIISMIIDGLFGFSLALLALLSHPGQIILRLCGWRGGSNSAAAAPVNSIKNEAASPASGTTPFEGFAPPPDQPRAGPSPGHSEEPDHLGPSNSPPDPNFNPYVKGR